MQVGRLANSFLTYSPPSLPPTQSLGLVAIHLHSHGGFLTKVTGISFGSELAEEETGNWALGNKMELVPFHQFLWLKLLHLTLGQVRMAEVLHLTLLPSAGRSTAVESDAQGTPWVSCPLK